jgi:hypothetical protein
MLLSRLKHLGTPVLSGMILLGLSYPVKAGLFHCYHCNPSCEVFSSPYFGYNPTCWRTWPPGQPPCPTFSTEPVTPIESGAPAAKPNGVEKLHQPAPAPSPKN